ncbi:MAG: DUF3298 and DUF4163 domain-containing protein [Novosphingobium sp.]
MRPIGLILPLLALPLLSLVACRVGAPSAPEPSTTATEAANRATPPAPSAPPAPLTLTAGARDVREKTEFYEFAYSYPIDAAAIPDLRDWLEADLAKTRTGLVSEAKEGRDDAKANAYPFNPYSASSAWKVVTNLPGWLSLSALSGSYTGGAHGSFAFDAVVWDKSANMRRAATDLFTAPSALKAAILKPFCAELSRQRAKKRAGERVGDSNDEFNTCVDPLEQTVILGSTSRKGFDRIGFLIAPYNAGPYAEGTYEVTLPVTPAVFAAVKPEYRAAFVAP